MALCVGHVSSRFASRGDRELALPLIAIGAALLCVALPAALAWWRRERAFTGYLVAAWAVWLLPLVLRFGKSAGFDLGDAIAALAFMAFWGFVGWLALRAGHRGLFGVAFAFAAGRMLVVYFEAFGGLSTTGFGLIGGGLLLLGLAWAGWWLSKRAGRTAAGATP